MTSTPSIALLVPCYNAARFLPRLYQCIQELTLPFTQVLCWDDGSTDDTVEVARTLGLQIISGHANGGVAFARNQLAEAAQTDWIHFHDADDLIAPEFVERLLPLCDEEHDVVSCDADWIDDLTRSLVIAWRYDGQQLLKEPFKSLLTLPMSLNNTVIRKRLWMGVGGCDERLSMWEDADVHIRLARFGARFHHVSEVLTVALRRQESFSHDYRKSWTCRVEALERYASASGADEVRVVLASESEKAAAQLALLNERPAAERALALCRKLGGVPPTSQNPMVRLLKLFMPAYSLLRWQETRRQRARRAQ